jgi:hypothetical protein
MPPFSDQRLSAADALATVFCECSMQPAQNFVLSGSVAWTLELALGRLGNNTSQVRLLVVPVLGLCTVQCVRARSGTCLLLCVDACLHRQRIFHALADSWRLGALGLHRTTPFSKHALFCKCTRVSLRVCECAHTYVVTGAAPWLRSDRLLTRFL